MANTWIRLCFIVFFASLTLPSECSSHQFDPKTSPALFIFGDSLFDAGNNNYINTTSTFQANFWPYGESFFKYPTGRFSDGRLIPDFIAEYAKLPLIPPSLQTSRPDQLVYGVNFASGGAGALVETYPGMVINLKMQLRNFKHTKKELREELGNKEANRLVSNAVYMFSVGSNDYFIPFVTNSSVLDLYGPEKYVNSVIGNLTAVMKEIYKKGGRKFSIFNMGPLGCVPFFRAFNNGECKEELTALVKLHNALLQKKLKLLEKNLKEFRYSLFDLFTIVSQMMDSPSKYGFEEVKSACCGSGPYRGIPNCGGRGGIREYQLCDNVSEYFFFDGSHPTEAAYRLFAKLMWDGAPNLTDPYNLKSLFQFTDPGSPEN